MYNVDKSLEKLANEIIENEMPQLGIIRIAYLKCDQPNRLRHEITYLDTQKLEEKISILAGTDFVITSYADSTDLIEEEKRVLLKRELECVYVFKDLKANDFEQLNRLPYIERRALLLELSLKRKETDINTENDYLYMKSMVNRMTALHIKERILRTRTKNQCISSTDVQQDS